MLLGSHRCAVCGKRMHDPLATVTPPFGPIAEDGGIGEEITGTRHYCSYECFHNGPDTSLYYSERVILRGENDGN